MTEPEFTAGWTEQGEVLEECEADEVDVSIGVFDAGGVVGLVVMSLSPGGIVEYGEGGVCVKDTPTVLGYRGVANH